MKKKKYWVSEVYRFFIGWGGQDGLLVHMIGRGGFVDLESSNPNPAIFKSKSKESFTINAAMPWFIITFSTSHVTFPHSFVPIGSETP